MADYAELSDFDVIPPPDKGEYEYTPKPADQIPPLGAREAYHYFSDPRCLRRQGAERECIGRLPKKVERLRARRYDAWGIYCVDGLSFIYVLIILSLFVLAGCIFGIAWAEKHNDVQAGMGITQVILAVGAGLMGVIALRMNKV